jgi:hypothetical protein
MSIRFGLKTRCDSSISRIEAGQRGGGQERRGEVAVRPGTGGVGEGG